MCEEERKQEQRVKEDRLIEKALRGDGQAFDALVDLCDISVSKVCWAILKNRQLVDEVRTSVWAHVHKQLHKFRHESSFSTWVHTIVKQKCVDVLKRQIPDMVSIDEREDNFEADTTTLEEQVLLKIQFEEIDSRVRAALDEIDCLIYLLFIHHGMSYSEIAFYVHRRPEAVRMRLNRKIRPVIRRIGLEYESGL